MGDYATSLIIEELVDGEVRRSIVLTGAAMPVQGAPWGGKGSIKTSWYPGAEEASQAVLGPQESPSQWSGEWHRTTLENGAHLLEGGARTELRTPMALATALEDMFRRMRRLRVTWATSGATEDEFGLITREGRASSWDFKWTRVHDVDWSVTFDWASRGQKRAPVTTSRDSTVTTTSKALQAAITDAIAKEKRLRLASTTPTRLTLGQLDALASAPGNLARSVARGLTVIEKQFSELGEVARKVGNIPNAVGAASIDFSRNTAALVNKFRDDVSAVSPELLSTRSTPASVLLGARLYGDVDDAVALAARRAAEFEAAVVAAIKSSQRSGDGSNRDSARDERDVIAVHVAKTGDTPERLSMKYYGNADRGADILRANRLPWHTPTLVAGTPLIIPRLRAASPAQTV